MEEIWRDIPEYDGLYQVSNLGRVKSVARLVKRRHVSWVKEKILKQAKNQLEYHFVALTKSKKNPKRILVHRIVAKAFPEICGEYFEGAEVDHIDGDRENNAVTNLRWVTHRENTNNPITKERKKNKCGRKGRPVIQYDLDGNFIKEWESINDCRKAGFTHVDYYLYKKSIRKCSYKGYRWAFAST